MCGIVTVAAIRGLLPARAAVEKMRDTLAHRGPNDATFEEVDGWVALAHRRLSILDIEGARQPLRSESGDIVCIFNGEIYNFAELRTRLRALDHVFATNGDGEVIVHGYEQWGEDIFAMLEGMFTIVLVDRTRRITYLARDRFGIKPLFYEHTGNQVRAASELKALVVERHSNVASRAALELGALRMHVPWPLTAFDGIFRLPPGSALKIPRDGEPRLFRFAAMVETPRANPAQSPEEALGAMRTAVARQMVADVPVGAFLSGGIDSTLIVALMRELTNAQLHTFSIRTLDHDESDVAAETARTLGTTHHTITLEEIKFSDLSELPRLYDEPFAETSALGVRALSRFAREHVTVALSGDGGDEVFGGYSSYRWIQLANAWRIPGRARIGTAAHQLLVRRPWPSVIRRALRTLLLAGTPETAQRDLVTLSWASATQARGSSERLSDAIAAASGVELSKLGPARRAMVSDRLERLPNAMLAKVDGASMSASLEVRVPMIDDELVRYADRVPIDQLVGSRFGKLLLRRALALTSSENIAWHSKRGFSLPLDRWMRSTDVSTNLEQLFGDLGSRLLEITGYRVTELWRRFCVGGSQFSAGTAAMQLLWFANVALWSEQFGVRCARESSVLPVV